MITDRLKIKIRDSSLLLRRRSTILAILSSLFLFGMKVEAQKYPQPTGWVNDFAGMISLEYKRQITDLIAETERKTTAEITVVTVKTTHPQPIDMYAVELFTHWEIGKKGKDNGVLIVAAIQDRKVWIETGYGVEGILPDGLCGEIYRKVLKPNFQQGEFGKGLILATSVIADKIGKEHNVKITGTERAPQINYGKKSTARSLFPILFFLLIFSGRFFIPLLLMGGMRGGYWGSGTFGGGGGFGGGFGGFGGGSCGGGGTGGSW